MTRLTGKDIAEIAKLLDQSQFGSLDLKMDDFSLRIRRDGAGGGGGGEDTGFSQEPIAEPASAAAPIAPQTPAAAAPQAGEVDVPAPLLGNFYDAPRPGDAPFVSVGDRVEEDTTICIIEVMKLMNPIRAGLAGTVTAVLAENGTMVEQGDTLIRVKADS